MMRLGTERGKRGSEHLTGFLWYRILQTLCSMHKTQ